VNADVLVQPTATLLQAMDALTKGNQKIVFVVDEDHVLLGTLTDGDIRRFILAGHSLTGSIEGAYNRRPVSVEQGTLTLPKLRALLQERTVDVVPIVDGTGRVVDCVTWHDIFEAPPRPADDIAHVPVVIMAGGFGTRMQPFTHVLPKPLVPIDGKPVIDHIIERFATAGAKSFYAMVHHKARILKAYLEDAHPDGSVRIVEEAHPRGTAGALRLLAGQVSGPVLVTNCDVLVGIRFRDLVDFHVKSGHTMTMVASVRTFQLPYGACTIGPHGTLEGIEEKPALTRLVNTGLYVIDAAAFADIPDHHVYHMNTFMSDLMASGRPVSVFPASSEAWVDVGQWDEYRRANRLLGPSESPGDGGGL